MRRAEGIRGMREAFHKALVAALFVPCMLLCYYSAALSLLKLFPGVFNSSPMTTRHGS